MPKSKQRKPRRAQIRTNSRTGGASPYGMQGIGYVLMPGMKAISTSSPTGWDQTSIENFLDTQDVVVNLAPDLDLAFFAVGSDEPQPHNLMAELVLSEAHGEATAAYGTVLILAWRDGKPRPLGDMDQLRVARMIQRAESWMALSDPGLLRDLATTCQGSCCKANA